MRAVIPRSFFCCATVLVLLAMPDAGAVASGEHAEKVETHYAPSFSEAQPSNEADIADSNLDLGLDMQLSSELPAPAVSSEGERDLLRLIYRTLTKRDVQIDSQLALAEMLLQMQQDTEQLKTIAQQQGVTMPAVQATSPPVVIPKPEYEKFDPLTLIGPIDAHLLAAMGVLLLLLLIVRHQRRAAQALLSTHEPRADFEPAQRLFSEVSDAEGYLDQETVLSPEVPLETVPARSPIQTSDHWHVSLNQPPAKPETSQMDELAKIILSVGEVPGTDELLQRYIQSNPKQALQLWIRLLEIYRENEKRPEFEKLSAMLNQNFNVECVPWDSVRSVEQLEMTLQLLPHIRDRVDASWGRPECLDYLLRLLLNNRNGERHGFSLAVTKEILILIDLMAAEQQSDKKPGSS